MVGQPVRRVAVLHVTLARMHARGAPSCLPTAAAADTLLHPCLLLLCCPCAQLVFSEAEWIGTLEENPDERPMPLPPELRLGAGPAPPGAGDAREEGAQQQPQQHAPGSYHFVYGASAREGASRGPEQRVACNVLCCCVVFATWVGVGGCRHVGDSGRVRWQVWAGAADVKRWCGLLLSPCCLPCVCSCAVVESLQDPYPDSCLTRRHRGGHGSQKEKAGRCCSWWWWCCGGGRCRRRAGGCNAGQHGRGGCGRPLRGMAVACDSGMLPCAAVLT